MATPTASTTASLPVLPPVTTATATAPATAGAATTPATAGASTLTTMAPAAPAESKGCSGAIKSCFSSIWKGICSCLSCLPWIGKYFKEEGTPTNTPANPPVVVPPVTTPAEADVQCVARIRALFTPATAPGTPAVAGTEDVIVYALGEFARIQAPHARMEAFSVILSSPASSPDIARRFHGVLSSRERMVFENHMFRENGNSHVVRGVNHGVNFGYQMVLNHIDSDVAKRAAVSCANAFRDEATAAAAAAAAIAAVSSTSTSTSTLRLNIS